MSKIMSGLAGVAILALLAAGFLTPTPTVAKSPTASTALAKQTGGSTGDSMIVAPDTSASTIISKNAKNWFVAVSVDSLASFRIQVSPDVDAATDALRRWFTVEFDSVPSREAEISSNHGNAVGQYAGWRMRVILDNLTAAGAPFGRSTLGQNEGTD